MRRGIKATFQNYAGDEYKDKLIYDVLLESERKNRKMWHDRFPLRPTCLQCVAKHLGQANVLLKETCKGYPEHYFIAIGHLAEAEDECVMKYPGFAAFLRDLRLQLEDDAGFREVYPWATVFIQVSEYLKRD